jgi:hypothetical protein
MISTHATYDGQLGGSRYNSNALTGGRAPELAVLWFA